MAAHLLRDHAHLHDDYRFVWWELESDTHDNFVCGTTIAKRGAAHAARRVDLWEFVRTSAVRKHRVGSELSVTL